MSETAIIAVHGGLAAAKAKLPYDRRTGKYRCPACGGPGSLFASDRYGGDGDVRRIGITCWTGCSPAAIHAAAITDLPIHVSERRRSGIAIRPVQFVPPAQDPIAERDAQARIETANLLWDAATVADGTPAHRYLARRRVWPGASVGAPPIPPAVRFLSRRGAPDRFRKWTGLPPATDVTGAIVYAHADPVGAVRAVTLDAVTASGRLPAGRWRRTFGRLVGTAIRIGIETDQPMICITEGPLDALATYWCVPHSHVYAAGGANRLASRDLGGELLRSGKRIAIEPDGDTVGTRAAWTLYQQLPAETIINWRESGSTDPAAEWRDAFEMMLAELVERGETPLTAARQIWRKCIDRRASGETNGPRRVEAADRRR